MKNDLVEGEAIEYFEYGEMGLSNTYAHTGLNAISNNRLIICMDAYKVGEYANPILLKINPDLTEAWQETISLPGYDFVFLRDFDLVGEQGSEGYVMSVTVEDGPSIYQFASILRTDTLGNILWRHDLETNDIYNPMVKSLPNGKFAIGWSKDEDDHPLGEDDYPLFPYIGILNDSGEMENIHHFIAPYRKEISRIRIASNGDIIGCGITQNPNMHNTAAWLFRLSPTAELLWEREFSNEELYLANGIPTCPFFDVVETPDGGLAATGCIATPSNDAGVWEGNVWLMKVDERGCLEPGCTEQEIILAVEETESGLLKVAPSKRLRISPNPANNETLVQLPDFANANEELHIYAMNRALIKRIALPQGAKNAVLNTAHLPDGLYLINRVAEGAVIASGKLVVQ